MKKTESQVKDLTSAQKLGNKLGNYTALAVVTAMPAVAFANGVEQPDVSQIVTYIGYATVAAVAIGNAKLIPAAAMWLYTKLANMSSRG